METHSSIHSTATARRTVAAALIAAALSSGLLAVAGTATAASTSHTVPTKRDGLICRYKLNAWDEAVYADAGGKPGREVGTLTKGSTVSAYKDITWSDSANVTYRKLSNGNWAIADGLDYIPNQNCMS
ncbi:hypothetical protein [Nocardia africana]|uniref:Uncharacterized protein n=1 Tax=Nocardia africana TaxID=134964 RepID=A0ABW6NTC7_9NOCA